MLEFLYNHHIWWLDFWKKDHSWGVWFFEGTYRVLKNGEHRFSGNVRPCRVTTRFGKRRSF